VGVLSLHIENTSPNKESSRKMANGALTKAGTPTFNQYCTELGPVFVSSRSKSSTGSLKSARLGASWERVRFVAFSMARAPSITTRGSLLIPPWNVRSSMSSSLH